MNLETFKIVVRAYFPDVEFVQIDSFVECYSRDLGWLRMIYWEDGNAYFAISSVVMSEGSLVTYLKSANRTVKLYESGTPIPGRAHIAVIFSK